MSDDLTEAQLRVQLAIEAELAPPNYSRATNRGLGKALGIKSPNGVQCHVKALVKKGYIRLCEGRAGFMVLKRVNENG